MLITSFGNSNKDGRPQILIGLTPADFAHLAMEDAVYLNEQETEDSPLPIHLICMMGEDNEELEARVDGWVEQIREENNTECDHDWEDVDGRKVCTYGCGAVRAEEERSDGQDDV